MANTIITVAGLVSSLITISDTTGKALSKVKGAVTSEVKFQELAERRAQWHVIWEGAEQSFRNNDIELDPVIDSNIIKAIQVCKDKTQELEKIFQKARVNGSDDNIDKFLALFQRVTHSSTVEEHSRVINEKTEFIVKFLQVKLKTDTTALYKMVEQISQQLKLIEQASQDEEKSTIKNNAKNVFNQSGEQHYKNYGRNNQMFFGQSTNNNNYHQNAHHHYYKGEEDIKDRILISLRYPEMSSRLQDIKPHEEKTFEWIFHSSSASRETLQVFEPGQRPRSNIVMWFSSGSGTYLVLGKPGSGKSTFMKFLVGDKRIHQELEHWSAGAGCQVLFHSFWGLSKQTPAHNWKGFLAHLAHQFVSSSPSVDPFIVSKGQTKTDFDSWSISELEEVVMTLLKGSHKRICLFIDGVDELETTEQISNLLSWTETVTSSKNELCKVCLATRSTVDTDRLDAEHRMKIHHFTAEDIKLYVVTNLQGYMKRHPTQGDDPKVQSQLQGLARTISRRADGVWIWAYYVLLLIEESFAMEWDLDEIGKMVEEFPVEVKELYRRALSLSIQRWPQLDQQRSRMLELSSRLPLALFEMFITVDDKVRAQYLAHCRPQEESRLAYLCQIFQVKLYRCTGCLVECYEESTDSYWSSSTNDFRHVVANSPQLNKLWALAGAGANLKENYAKFQNYWQTAPWRTKRVRLIHRTVHEFLEEERIVARQQIPSHIQRNLAEAMLACYIEDVYVLNTTSLETLCGSLDGLTEHGLQVVQTVDEICHQLTERRCGRSSFVAQNISGNGLKYNTWLHTLIPDRCREYQDFAGLLFSNSSSTAAEYILRHQIGTWSSYYMSYLALCAIRTFEAKGTQLHCPLQSLLSDLEHAGADLYARHSSPGYGRVLRTPTIQTFRTDSVITRLLTVTVVELFYTLWDRNVSLENGENTLRNTRKALENLVQVRLENVHATYFVFLDETADKVVVDAWWAPSEFEYSDLSVDGEVDTCNENRYGEGGGVSKSDDDHHNNENNGDEESLDGNSDHGEDYGSENEYDSDDSSDNTSVSWNECAVMVQIDASKALQTLVETLQRYDLDLFRSDEAMTSLIERFSMLSPSLYLSLLNEETGISFWWPCPIGRNLEFARTVFSGKRKELGKNGRCIIRDHGDDVDSMWQERLISHADVAIEVPVDAPQLPLEPRVETTGNNWKELCTLREYYAYMKKSQENVPTLVEEIQNVSSVGEARNNSRSPQDMDDVQNSASAAAARLDLLHRSRCDQKAHRWTPY